MMKIGDRLICAYAGQTEKLSTQGNYEVLEVLYGGTHVSVYDLDNGEVVKGDYLVKRFIKREDMINQVLENAQHG